MSTTKFDIWRPEGTTLRPLALASETMGQMNAPLSGIRVLDFTRVLAGPHATLMLADLGAHVIKIEPPAGDVTRFQSPRRHSMASYFAQQNVGKQCTSIDLTKREGVELVLALAQHCDVVVENYRAGVMDRLGLGYEAIAALRPDIIYCSISGYGHTGPWTQRRAYAPVVGAEAGLTKSQGDQRGGVYTNDRHSHADTYTALEASTAICAALFAREQSGGDHIDISMAETLLYVNEHVHNDLWDGDDDPSWVRSFGNEDHPVVQVGNGDWAVIASNPAIGGAFEMFMAAIGRADLIDDQRFSTTEARKQHMGELQALIRDFAAQQPDVDALEATCAAHPSATGALAVGRVRSVAELADTDWAAERHAVRTVSDRGGGTLRLPNVPWHFRRYPDVGREVAAPRYRGEDNAAVLSEVLGMSNDQIDELVRAGVLSQHRPRSN